MLRESKLSSWYPRGVNPTYGIDFITNPSIPPGFTFARADATTCATYFNASGVLTTAAANVARFDYNPSTLLPRGLLMEESRTNSIRNNTMVGVVAGTPGTPPTNWTVGSGNGISSQIVGSGTANGINYVDIRWYGTATVQTFPVVYFEVGSAITASNGQTWTNSAFVSLAGGSTSGVALMALAMRQNTSGGVFLANLTGSDILSSLSANLNRLSFTGTTNQATIGQIAPAISMTVNNGVSIDITLRIGMPQMELGAYASSVIPTSTVAVTRAADSLYTTSIPWFNATQGTMVANLIPLNTTSYNQIAEFDDGTLSNRVSLSIANNAASRLDVASGGTISIGALQYGVATAGNLQKNGVAYQSSAPIGVAANNGSAVTGYGIGTGTFVAPVGVSNLWIGSRAGGGVNFSGWLQSFKYWNTALAAAQLQKVTT